MARGRWRAGARWARAVAARGGAVGAARGHAVGYPLLMRTLDLTVVNPSGLHARPASLFVEAAARFNSRITVENLDREGRPVDAKSILMLLTAGVQRGHRIRLSADGPDEEEALAALRELVEGGLGEGSAVGPS